MCKKNIETAVKINGVKKAVWNEETKVFKVTFDDSKISLNQIHEKIAAAGYDTEKTSGSDKAYNSLEECCKYDRKVKKS